MCELVVFDIVCMECGKTLEKVVPEHNEFIWIEPCVCGLYNGPELYDLMEDR